MGVDNWVFTKKRRKAVSKKLKTLDISDNEILNFMQNQADINIRQYDDFFLVVTIPGSPWKSRGETIRDALKIAMQPCDAEIHEP